MNNPKTTFLENGDNRCHLVFIGAKKEAKGRKICSNILVSFFNKGNAISHLSNIFMFFSRSHAPAWECIGDTPASRNPKRLDAGASFIHSHAGAWEREKSLSYAHVQHTTLPKLFAIFSLIEFMSFFHELLPCMKNIKKIN
jgi:hypothetical protein